MVEFDLNRAFFLTYVGVGAAFVVLGSLIVYTWLVVTWGNWRRRRAEASRNETVPQTRPAATPESVPLAAAPIDPQLAAAIAAAVALALEADRRERLEADRQPGEIPAADGDSWKEQGRIVAFDSRRLRERER